MSGPNKEGDGQPPADLPPGVAGNPHPVRDASWTQLLVVAIASRRMALAVTLLGAVAAMAVHVFYAVVIQGWGTPLP